MYATQTVMTSPTLLARRRAHAQGLGATTWPTPEAAVSALGAVQSQDYPGAAWAVAQRTHGARTADDLRAALDAGRVLRTHVLRPTWHLVAPADIRWMLALTASRVHAAAATQYRAQGLDDAAFARCHDALADALADGRHRTRDELARALTDAGLDVGAPLRMVQVMMHAELEGLVCSGAMRGAQHTYARLDDRAPKGAAMARDEALRTLATRYFVSHGPATERDFAWWSGLTLTDARAAVAHAGDALVREVVGDVAHWRGRDEAGDAGEVTARLLSNYDELLVAYADRGAVVRDVPADKLDARGNVLFQHTVAVDGVVVGTWRRVVTKRALRVEVTAFRGLRPRDEVAVRAEVERMGAFLGVGATVTIA